MSEWLTGFETPFADESSFYCEGLGINCDEMWLYSKIAYMLSWNLIIFYPVREYQSWKFHFMLPAEGVCSSQAVATRHWLHIVNLQQSLSLLNQLHPVVNPTKLKIPITNKVKNKLITCLQNQLKMFFPSGEWKKKKSATETSWRSMGLGNNKPTVSKLMTKSPAPQTEKLPKTTKQVKCFVPLLSCSPNNILSQLGGNKSFTG